MADAATEKAQAPPSPKELTPAEKEALLVADLKQNLLLLKRAVVTSDSRIIARVLRQTPTFRKKLTAPVLIRLVENRFPADSTYRAEMLAQIKAASGQMAVDEAAPAPAAVADADMADAEDVQTKTVLPETEVYIHLLTLVFLLDNKQTSEATSCSAALVKRLQAFNRRTLDQLAAKAYFYYSQSFESANRLAEIRSTLLAAYRTATLRHDETNQAMLLNLLLRNYLHYNLYDQADKLVSKTTFPQAASNNQTARYMYYLGRIKAVQLAYTDAYLNLQQALRKSPQHTARGFRVAVHKLSTLVELLTGETPDRAVFHMPGLRKPLLPYLRLTQAVRVGDLQAFQHVLDEFGKVFKDDKTYTLILRLRQNVIRMGLRKINVAYSCISFQDIADKLHLESTEVAEGVVAKAIADGVINASIDHERGFMHTQENIDLYSTQQPSDSFHRRIEFMVDIHHQAVKAMTFPADMHKSELESEESRRERLTQEAEFANSLAEDDDDDF